MIADHARRQRTVPSRRFAPALGLSYLVTLTEIFEQHYYRARFSSWRMYFPVILTPMAIGAAFLMAAFVRSALRALLRSMNVLMLAVGLLRVSFYWLLDRQPAQVARAGREGLATR